MWIERRMTDGPRQTKADAASCPLKKRSARIGPVHQVCATVVTTGGRAGRRLHRTPPGHHLHSGVDVIHHPNVRRGPDQERRAASEQRSNEPKPVAPRPMWAEHNRIADRRGAFLTTTDPLVEIPSTPWWRHASRDRTHRSARDWQRYVVGKVLLSSETARDPDAGTGGIATIKIAGARAGELATRPTIERGGRLKSARYATIAFSHPR
jgi:hypothetical protein